MMFSISLFCFISLLHIHTHTHSLAAAAAAAGVSVCVVVLLLLLLLLLVFCLFFFRLLSADFSLSSSCLKIESNNNCHSDFILILATRLLQWNVCQYNTFGEGDEPNCNLSICRPLFPILFASKSSNCEFPKFCLFSTLLAKSNRYS